MGVVSLVVKRGEEQVADIGVVWLLLPLLLLSPFRILAASRFDQNHTEKSRIY